MEVDHFGAFIAGLLSFVSPCVLPLVPAYICFVSGTSLDELTGDDPDAAARGEDAPKAKTDTGLTLRVFLSSLAFVVGFGVVFVGLGAGATTLGSFIGQYKDILSKIAGVVIILFGLHFMGVLKFTFLYFEKRVHLDNKPAGMLGSFILGLAFAFGWTPCVGPILATILMIAGGGGDMTYGITLLTAYAAGIGLPFLLASLAVKPFLNFMRKFRRHMRIVELTIGGLMVVTGLLIFFGSIAYVSQWMLETFPFLELG